jgi:hypothetical protein
MSLTTFFQPCPTCGRGLLIPIQCLGADVACSHCHGHFQARDTSCESYPRETQEPTLMDRADTLLMYGASQRSSQRLADYPLPYSSE